MSHHTDNFQTLELSESNNTIREFIGFLRDLVIIFLIVILLRSFIITPFRINGSSMETSYHDREYIIVDKFSYLNFPIYFKTEEGSAGLTSFIHGFLGKLPIHMGDPARGDAIVITPHVDKKKEFYIKRVIGLPNDKIKFEDGEVFIMKEGQGEYIKLDESYLSSTNKGQTRLPENVSTNEFTIPENHYWVMGDNRNNSADSRSCFRTCIGSSIESHFIKRKDIVGKVMLNLGYYNIFSEGGLLDSGKLSWTYPPRFFEHPKSWEYNELGE